MRERLAAHRDRVRDWVARALAEDNTPREVAASFAVGSIVAALPTAGVAVVAFVVLAALFDRVSKIGLLAVLVVYNPLVKWAIYGASIWLGTLLLGPVPGVTLTPSAPPDPLAAAPAVLARHLVGNVVIAVALAAVGYVVVLRLVVAHERRTVDDRSSE